MDPYSAEGELVNIHNAFHHGQYRQVADFDTSSFSPSNALPARILKLRARIALGEYEDVIAEVEGEEDTPDLAAVKAFAEYSKDPWDNDAAVQAAEQLAKTEADNLTVQLLCGTVLAAAGKMEEALGLLSRHQGSLDAAALIVQIHLQQNRTDLAAKEAQNARKWAQDSLLVNLAESWVGLRQGGEKYQSAFYVYEELAQAPATQSVISLVGQAVAELHIGRLDEAQAALDQAAGLDAASADVLANMVVLNTILGKEKEAEDARNKLSGANERHQLLVDLEEKKSEFQRACEKYRPRIEA